MFITKEELTVKRTPQELVKWVECKFQEITQQEGGSQAIRKREKRDGLLKQFIEEIYPLSILASFLFDGRNDITLQPVIGNQNYDAVITDYAFSPPHENKLEITLAEDKEYLVREMLQAKRYAPITGEIKKKGTKHTGEEYCYSIGVRSLEDYLNKQIELLSQALERKLKNKYERNTSLLMMFFDAGTSFDETDIREPLSSFIKDELWSKAEQQFSVLYLVSSSKKIFLKWPPSNNG